MELGLPAGWILVHGLQLDLREFAIPEASPEGATMRKIARSLRGLSLLGMIFLAGGCSPYYEQVFGYPDETHVVVVVIPEPVPTSPIETPVQQDPDTPEPRYTPLEKPTTDPTPAKRTKTVNRQYPGTGRVQ